MYCYYKSACCSTLTLWNHSCRSVFISIRTNTHKLLYLLCWLYRNIVMHDGLIYPQHFFFSVSLYFFHIVWSSNYCKSTLSIRLQAIFTYCCRGVEIPKKENSVDTKWLNQKKNDRIGLKLIWLCYNKSIKC